MLTRIATRVFAAAILISFTGCTFGPQYVRPELDLPQSFSEPTPSGDSIANLPWWEIFHDETLQGLIKTAIKNNRNLKVAMARLDAARAQVSFTRADQLPRIDLSGNATRIAPSDQTAGFVFPQRNDFGLFGNLSFELDFWGRARRATEAERAALLSTEYALRAVTIELVSNVASIYFTILELDNRLELSKGTLLNRKKATELIDARYKGGTVPEVNLNQAQIEEEDVAATITGIERQLRRAEHALALLLGTASLPQFSRPGLDMAQVKTSVPAGYPASLLERRPDVLAAEEQAKAASARVGVAIAERLPRLSLLGSIGLESGDTSDLGDGFAWSIGGSLLGPLLDFGKAESRVEGKKAEAEAALNSYEQTVFNAVREVEDALTGVRTFDIEHSTRLRQEKAAESAARTSRARYDDGVTSYLEVLDIERSLYEAQLAASSTRLGYIVSVVQLYAALGGGWSQS